MLRTHTLLTARLAVRAYNSGAPRTGHERPAFDGFAKHTEDCLIDFHRADYSE